MKWGDKPYHSLDYELKQRYGGKVYKLSLTSGCSCPNRDGSISNGGCIFCSEGGSGDFASKFSTDILSQIKEAKEKVISKCGKKSAGFIAYFQSYTTLMEMQIILEIYLKRPWSLMIYLVFQ